ncbi:MAG: OmpA family protein [candidate division WOR-3 bacterium]|nr:MAG: OmpA family protein [candidate division WOR-3 bacterium]
MRRFPVLILGLTLCAGVVKADPALGGGRGLFRVQDARVEEDGALVFANRVMFRKETIDDADVYRGPMFGLEMSYAPFPFVEVWGCLNNVAELGTSPWSFTYDQQGYQLGGKLSVPSLPVVKLAGSYHWSFEKDSFTFKETHEYMDGYFGSGSSWRVIGSFRFWELHKTLPTLMLNYGRSFEEGGPQFLGGGLEMASNAVDLFIEATSEIEPGNGGFFGEDAVARLTPGVRVRIPFFHLTGGLEVGLSEDLPKYTGVFGMNFISPFPKPPRKPWGRLAGKVEDARSGMPLDAKLEFVNARMGAMRTDPSTGAFYKMRVPTGVYIVQASKEGYIPEAVPMVVTDGEFAVHTFRLKSLVPYGTVTGRTYDIYSGRPVTASIGFRATEVAPVSANEVTGFFRADNVPAGLVVAVAELDGYFAEERITEVEDGEVTKLNIGMAPLDMIGAFKGKVVDKKSGDPVQSAISFVDVQRPDLRTDSTDGAFEVELPVGSYEVKVEALGYVAQTSSFAIEKGEDTERTFELVSKGMILTLKGVYFEFGKAELRTESYAALMEAARIMNESPEIAVEIQGHTDNIGTDEANQKLSEKRAYAVVNFLVQYGGIDMKRLTARGYGETEPVAPNDTDEGRQLNRRVDFVILK